MLVLNVRNEYKKERYIYGACTYLRSGNSGLFASMWQHVKFGMRFYKPSKSRQTCNIFLRHTMPRLIGNVCCVLKKMIFNGNYYAFVAFVLQRLSGNDLPHPDQVYKIATEKQITDIDTVVKMRPQRILYVLASGLKVLVGSKYTRNWQHFVRCMYQCYG